MCQALPRWEEERFCFSCSVKTDETFWEEMGGVLVSLDNEAMHDFEDVRNHVRGSDLAVLLEQVAAFFCYGVDCREISCWWVVGVVQRLAFQMIGAVVALSLQSHCLAVRGKERRGELEIDSAPRSSELLKDFGLACRHLWCCVCISAAHPALSLMQRATPSRRV